MRHYFSIICNSYSEWANFQYRSIYKSVYNKLVCNVVINQLSFYSANGRQSRNKFNQYQGNDARAASAGVDKKLRRWHVFRPIVLNQHWNYPEQRTCMGTSQTN